MADTRGTPQQLRVQVDASGNLVVVNSAQVNPLTESVFENARLAVDAAGNLKVTGAGGGGGGTPGGSNTDVQFNDSGTFGGSPSFTFNKTTFELDLGNYLMRPNVGTSNGDVSNEYGPGMTMYVDHDNTFGGGVNHVYFANSTNDLTLQIHQNDFDNAINLQIPDTNDAAFDSAPIAAIFIRPPNSPSTRNFVSGIWIGVEGNTIDKSRGIGILNEGLSDSYYTELAGAGGSGYAALLTGNGATGIVVENRGTGQVGCLLSDGTGGGTSNLLTLASDQTGAAEMMRVNSSTTSKVGTIYRMSGAGNSAVIVKDAGDNTVVDVKADTGLILSFIPTVRANRTANQSVNDSTVTYVQLNAADSYDTDSMHDTSTNNTRIIFNTAGVYSIVAEAQFEGNVTNVRYLFIDLNGVPTRVATCINFPTTAAPCLVQVSAQYKFAAGDYIEVGAFQDSGGALNVSNVWVGATRIATG